MARINPRMLIDGPGVAGPGTTDADPLAAVQAAVAASKNKVSEKNAEIATIAL